MQHDNLEELKNQSIGRLLWNYSAPAVVGMLATTLCTIIDRIYIGQSIGPEAIAGLGITLPVTNLSTALGVLIGAGAGARTSIMLGANDSHSAERVLGNSLTLTLLIGAIYISFFAIFLDDILIKFGASEVTLPYARDFMLWLLPGMFLTNLCFNLNSVMRSSGYPMRAMVTMMISAILNIILAPIFIFVFGLGIKGAAMATDISMAVSTLFVILHFMRQTSTVKFTPGTYALNARIVSDIVFIGAAPFFIHLASCLINVTINKVLKVSGSDLYIGAASIFISYTSFLMPFILGIGLGMQPIVGYNYGAGQLHRLKGTYRLSVISSSVIALLGCVVGLIWPGLIARIFTTDAELIDVTARGIRIAISMFWVVGFQVISTNFFQSIGKAGKSILMSLLRQVIFMYPLLLTLPEWFGLNGVWMSFPISDALATIVTIVLIIWQFRQIKQSMQ